MYLSRIPAYIPLLYKNVTKPSNNAVVFPDVISQHAPERGYACEWGAVEPGLWGRVEATAEAEEGRHAVRLAGEGQLREGARGVARPEGRVGGRGDERRARVRAHRVHLLSTRVKRSTSQVLLFV